MKIHSIALRCAALAALLSAAIPSPAQVPFSFRNQSWGTSSEEIKARESTQPVKSEPDYLVYAVSLLGFDFHAAYVFHNNRLYMGKYILKTQYQDLNDYIKAYQSLKDNLGTKYGKPAEDRTVWTNSRLEFDRTQWGQAMIQGDVTFYALWRIGDNEISIHLSGINSHVHLLIQYRDITVVTEGTASGVDML